MHMAAYALDVELERYVDGSRRAFDSNAKYLCNSTAWLQIQISFHHEI